MSAILVSCTEGIGDSIYVRPFIKQLCKDGHEVHVMTALPDLYADLEVTFIEPPQVRYRTQVKAFAKSKVTFDPNPREVFNRTIMYHYNPKDLRKHGIIAHMEQAFGYEVGSVRHTPMLDLPKALQQHGLDLPKGRKLAVIKPVTLRNEWYCPSRAPNPEYIGWCARMLRDAGYYIVSIADCYNEQEWIEGDEPIADLKLHNGELGLYKTLSLLKQANIVVGGSGMIVPAALAAGAPLFVVFGGRGEFDNPHKLFDLRMDMKKVGWALPTNFCRCADPNHECDKTIADLDSQFYRFMASIT